MNWEALNQLLIEKRQIEVVIKYRLSAFVNRPHRKRLMVKSFGLEGWEKLLLRYAGFSDESLKAHYRQLDCELNLRLEKHYTPS